MKEALEESNMNNTSQKVDVNITGKLTADGDDLVYVYDKNQETKVMIVKKIHHLLIKEG